MKKCNACKKIKNIENFSNKQGECKPCINLRSLVSRRTKTGLIKQMYYSQAKADKRGIGVPDYTKEELIVWVISQPNFNILYRNWVNSDYDRWLTPSCDRVNDYLPYRLSNLTLTTWKINADRGHRDSLSGKNKKKWKPVRLTMLDTKKSKDFPSITKASESTGINIKTLSNYLLGRRKYHPNQLWEYI